jgi:hypothetical protein
MQDRELMTKLTGDKSKTCPSLKCLTDKIVTIMMFSWQGDEQSTGVYLARVNCTFCYSRRRPCWSYSGQCIENISQG